MTEVLSMPFSCLVLSRKGEETKRITDPQSVPSMMEIKGSSFVRSFIPFFRDILPPLYLVGNGTALRYLPMELEQRRR